METTAAADKKELKASILDGGSGFSDIPKKASASGLSRGTTSATTLTECRMSPCVLKKIQLLPNSLCVVDGFPRCKLWVNERCEKKWKNM